MQDVLVVAAQPSSRLVDRHAVADAADDVLQAAPRTTVVEHLVAGDDPQVVPARERAQPCLLRDLFGATVADDERVEPIAEGLAQPRHRAIR